MAVVTIRQLLDSGVHFGHRTQRWNPKMKRFILTERSGNHIIDLQQSLSYIDQAYEYVRETVAAFLFNEWRNGALLGSKPEEAFFVRCDRSTMTQNDIDNGRLICLIGVAPVRPAEFVIFRIGQWTAERRG